MDQAGAIEELGREECLELMATQRVGRLGVIVDGVPLVLPMQFVLDGSTVVLQTNQGSKTLHTPLTSVSFEVDHVDWDQGVGWSVLVQGIGEDISTAIDERSETAPDPGRPHLGAASGGSLALDHPPLDHRPEDPRQLSVRGSGYRGGGAVMSTRARASRPDGRRTPPLACAAPSRA